MEVENASAFCPGRAPGSRKCGSGPLTRIDCPRCMVVPCSRRRVAGVKGRISHACSRAASSPPPSSISTSLIPAQRPCAGQAHSLPLPFGLSARMDTHPGIKKGCKPAAPARGPTSTPLLARRASLGNPWRSVRAPVTMRLSWWTATAGEPIPFSETQRRSRGVSMPDAAQSRHPGAIQLAAFAAARSRQQRRTAWAAFLFRYGYGDDDGVNCSP